MNILDHDLILGYLQESQSHVLTVRQQLESLEPFQSLNANDINQVVHSLFRSIHTLKGTSSYVGFRKIEQFTHSLEDILDSLRENKISLNDDLLQFLFWATDQLSSAFKSLEKNNIEDINVEECRNKVIINFENSLICKVGQKNSTTAHSTSYNVTSFENELTPHLNRLKRLFDFYALLPDNHIINKFHEQFVEIETITNHAIRHRLLRLIQDLENKLSKPLEFEFFSEFESIDKFLFEKVNQCLTHLIRNAIDHGIETTSERLQLQKNEKAKIKTEFKIQNKFLVIEISDDGRGLDAKKIFKKAVMNGLITDSIKITEAEIYQMIFLPGLSTSEKVSDFSGRGVGLDVVKKMVHSLNGSIDIVSIQNRGCKFILSLPLTFVKIPSVSLLNQSQFIYSGEVLKIDKEDSHYEISLKVSGINKIKCTEMPRFRHVYYLNTPENNSKDNFYISECGYLISPFLRE